MLLFNRKLRSEVFLLHESKPTQVNFCVISTLYGFNIALKNKPVIKDIL